MKNKFLVLSVLCTFVLITTSVTSYSQGIYQFWGATSYGGQDDKGVLFTTKYDGTGQKVKKVFTANNPGEIDRNNKPVQYNNKLYTVMSKGGLHNQGIISEYDISTGVYTKKVDFFTHDIMNASLGLTLYNGKMYSVSEYGGFNSSGSLYEFDPLTGSITIRHNFEGSTGRIPRTELTVFNNKLYGITSTGGDFDKGVIYEFNPATNMYTDLVHLSDYRAENGTFIVFQNKLWTTGVHVDDISTYSIFSFDPATNVIEYKKGLNSIGGTYHGGTLAILNNKFYGISSGGGIHGAGLIFQYDPLNNQLTKEYDLQNSVTVTNFSTMLAYNGLLYGASEHGGPNNVGVIFQFNPTTNQYSNKVIFSNNNGGHSTGFLCLHNDKMYLWTYREFASNTRAGELKEYNPGINSYSSLLSLLSTELRFPIGESVYLENKIYGITCLGGTYGEGGIYEYDPATELYTVKVNFPSNVLNIERTSLTLLNGKIYGAIGLEAPMAGLLFEYTPGENSIIPLHTFDATLGGVPAGNLSLYNNKLYGVTYKGGNLDYGTIFEYNLQTQAFAIKVNFDSTRGSHLNSGLTFYNNKFYGVASRGGSENEGTLYEYNPAINSLTKKIDFSANSTGSNPLAGLVVYNDKLYGTTSEGILPLNGSIYAYNPIAETITTLYTQNEAMGRHNIQRLTILNDKLYASATAGGLERLGGTLFEFNPISNSVIKKTDFIGENGRLPRFNKLLPIQARTAPGVLNSCFTSNSVTINTMNADQWVAFTDAEGRAVAEINANGNILGVTAVSFYINGNSVRKNADDLYYLDRNIKIRTENQPQSPIMIRLYIRKGEFEALKAATGGTMELSNLSIYQNNDECVSEMVSSVTALTTHKAAWATDYVLTASVDSLTSFYFANLDRVLPIRLISFTGKKEQEKNKLSWKLTSTHDVQFSLERSSNGQSFTSIGNLDASQEECNQNFYYYDSLPMPGINYYRLRITESNAAVHYSNIVVLNNAELSKNKLSIYPNPIHENLVQVSLQINQTTQGSFTVYDASGRRMAEKRYTLQQGMNCIQMEMGLLQKGIYTLVYQSGEQKITTKFLK